MPTRRWEDEAGRLDFERLRDAGTDRGRGQAEAGSDALPSFLGRVVTSGAKLRGGMFCRVVPTVAGGAEREGGTGTYAAAASLTGAATATSPPVLVYLMGSFVPSPGDVLVCRFVDHRWVAETTGGGMQHGSGIVLNSCFCEVPAVLTMTSADPSCNYRMFQSCSLAYGPPPAGLVAAGITDPVFASTQSFVDPVLGRSFYYYFTCAYNQFFLTRIYPPAGGNRAVFDGILYNWIIGAYANSCAPFLLNYGMPYPGSDASCSVTISG